MLLKETEHSEATQSHDLGEAGRSGCWLHKALPMNQRSVKRDDVTGQSLSDSLRAAAAKGMDACFMSR